MKTSPSLETTLNLVDALFHGRLDKGGQPISLHSRRCVGFLPSAAPSTVQKAMALHDVLEDTVLTPASLRDLGYSAYTVKLVEIVTLRDGESYDDGIARIVNSGEPWAVIMKLADNQDNTDEARLTLIPSEHQTRLRARYAGVRARLIAALPPQCQKTYQ